MSLSLCKLPRVYQPKISALKLLVFITNPSSYSQLVNLGVPECVVVRVKSPGEYVDLTVYVCACLCVAACVCPCVYVDFSNIWRIGWYVVDCALKPKDLTLQKRNAPDLSVCSIKRSQRSSNNDSSHSPTASITTTTTKATTKKYLMHRL